MLDTIFEENVSNIYTYYIPIPWYIPVPIYIFLPKYDCITLQGIVVYCIWSL